MTNRKPKSWCSVCHKPLQDKRSINCFEHRQLLKKKKCKHCNKNIPKGSGVNRTICRDPKCLKKRKQKYHRTERLKLYGLTKESFLALLKSQDQKCAICQTKPQPCRNGEFVVDHCHKTGKIRGILCRKCNLGIGHFNEDVVTMIAAVTYMKKESIL